MSNWHNTAVTQARTAREAANKHIYEDKLDSFTTKFESLSKLDGTDADHDLRPGSVSTLGGVNSLRKTDEGFVMTLLCHQPTNGALSAALGRSGAIGGSAISKPQKTETYTVNEELNTISYKRTAEPFFSGAGAALKRPGGEISYRGSSPIMEESYVLDLNTGTITDLGQPPETMAGPPLARGILSRPNQLVRATDV